MDSSRAIDVRVPGPPGTAAGMSRTYMREGCVLESARRDAEGRMWCLRCSSYVAPVMSRDGRYVDDVRCPRMSVIASRE